MTEILYILRPLIYVGMVWKLGLKNKVPFLVSFVIEFMCILFTEARLRKHSDKKDSLRLNLEKKEQKQRIFLLLKYFIREPVFSNFTVKLIEKVVSKVSPALMRLILSVISYYRYYAYIA
jgi:peroxin-16